ECPGGSERQQFEHARADANEMVIVPVVRALPRPAIPVVLCLGEQSIRIGAPVTCRIAITEVRNHEPAPLACAYVDTAMNGAITVWRHRGHWMLEQQTAATATRDHDAGPDHEVGARACVVKRRVQLHVDSDVTIQPLDEPEDAMAVH